MGVRNYDLTKNPVVRGASWEFAVRYLQPDGNTPVDLTGCTARMRVRRSGDEELTWTAVVTVGTGTISVARTTAETTALNFSSAVYFLDVIFPSKTVTLLTGAIFTK